jgi:hypothetical protein
MFISFFELVNGRCADVLGDNLYDHSEAVT